MSDSVSKHQAATSHDTRCFVSLALAGFNEAAIVEKNLATLCDYMESLEAKYRWEIVFVNDGSEDDTGALAEAFAVTRQNVRVLHHPRNFGLGQALQTAFANCRGDYIVVLDIDLSYGPEHIPKLVDRIQESKAKIVATSPYMKGGKISNVPWLRKYLSVGSNRFLSTVAKGNLSSLTPMVRAYDRKFVQKLDLGSMGMDINLEIIHKAMLLNAHIEEIPSHLDWALQREEGDTRQSKMKIFRHTVAVLVWGFLFRPVLFFLVPGLIFLAASIYTNFWTCLHIYEQYQKLPPGPWGMDRFDAAVAAAFSVAPHTIIIGGMTLLLAVNFIAWGILALQNTNYFEQMFHLGTTIMNDQRQSKKGDG